MKRVLVPLVVVLVSCQQYSTEPSDDPATFEGTIVEITTQSNGKISVLLDNVTSESLAPDYVAPIIRIHFERSIPIFLQQADGFEEGSVEHLQAGQQLEVWTTGAVMRSIPPQYNATELVILPL